jgi:hypothetical protein
LKHGIENHKKVLGLFAALKQPTSRLKSSSSLQIVQQIKQAKDCLRLSKCGVPQYPMVYIITCPINMAIKEGAYPIAHIM